jgi:flavin-dependent dehydrogenase
LTTDVDAIVIGAGVVGLAVALALSLSGFSIVVLESEVRFALDICGLTPLSPFPTGAAALKRRTSRVQLHRRPARPKSSM